MADSRTRRTLPPPILGGLFGVKGGYKTTIKEGNKRATGFGSTAKESQEKAANKWRKSNNR